MAVTPSKKVPAAPADKSIKKEALMRGQKADTGTDPMNRYQNQYAKNPPQADDPLADMKYF